MNKYLLSIFILIAMPEAWSATITDNFSSSDNWDLTQSTAVLNKALGRVHPTLRVLPWGASSSTTDFSVGDGSDGVFSPATYTRFGTFSSNVITIDSDRFQFLNVTAFTLSAGHTLRISGDVHLRIHSQSDIVIAGTVDCAGGAGDSLAGTDLTTIALGGTGKCGGGTGGTGGNVVTPNGALGSSGGATLTGGAGGATGAAGAGGNGGSGYSLNLGGFLATQGQNNGTAVPTNNDDGGFTIFGGGSGGGGGGRGTTSNGAGGGAGGGVVRMYAVRDINMVPIPSETGTVTADGGPGGIITSGVAGTVGGAGGSGGGGSIRMFAGRTIQFGGAAGPPYYVTATKGTSPASQGFDGGNGSLGRTWLVDGDDAAAPGYPNGSLDDPISNLGANIGRVEFHTDEQVLVSKVLDLNSSKPTFVSASLSSSLSGGSTAVLEARGSTDSAQTDVTAWVNSSQISQLDGYRYIQLRIRLDNNEPSNYSYVTGITIQYELYDQKKFEMIAGCGRVGTNMTPILLLGFGLLLLSFLLKKQRRLPTVSHW